jgi:hypothetical protein
LCSSLTWSGLNSQTVSAANVGWWTHCRLPKSPGHGQRRNSGTPHRSFRYGDRAIAVLLGDAFGRTGEWERPLPGPATSGPISGWVRAGTAAPGTREAR